MNNEINENGQTVVVAGRGNNDTRPSRICRYIFTFNNYKSEYLVYFKDKLDEICKAYCYQSEIGKETKTKHIQGVIWLHRKMAMSTVNTIFGNKLWMNPCKDWAKAILYCQKDDTYDGVCREMKNIKAEIIKPVLLLPYDEPNVKYPWQWMMEHKLLGDVERRKIIWVKSKGGCGKSSFTRYMKIKYNKRVISFTNCKTADIAKCLSGRIEAKNIDILNPIFIMDIPFDKIGKINYSCLEELKNGSVFSPKYESQEIMFGYPHVIIFANCYPDYNRLTKGRWQIYHIDNDLQLEREICVDGS